ncbi:EamA family transporter RarD [Vibrio sp. WJH972]
MNNTDQSRKGVSYAVGAYTMWGISPIYFKVLHDVPALDILSHRIIWSFVFLAGLVLISRQAIVLKEIVQSKKKMGILLVTSLLVATNWLVYIWAVNSDHMLDASLGYYINPLVNVLLGMLFLGERLRKLQWLAVLLAAIGVGVQIIVFGSIPIVAIVLAVTFGFYGLLRKKVSVGSQTGLFVETLFLVPAALIYVFFITDSATSDFTSNSLSFNLLLMSAGFVTTLPLLSFASAAARLKLSTLGFFQYIGPSIMLILAVIFYGEVFSLDKAITFGFIWAALLLFSIDGLKTHKALPKVGAISNSLK